MKNTIIGLGIIGIGIYLWQQNNKKGIKSKVLERINISSKFSNSHGGWHSSPLDELGYLF